MHSLVVRPLLVFITFLLLVFALMQTLGRVAMWGIDGFQGAINTLLEDQEIVVSGLSGDWQRLNPVLRIDDVRLPAGTLQDVLVELDVLETILRNRPVMQRLFVERASVEVERTDQGWWLAGMVRGESEFDVVAMLEDSDEIRVIGEVAVRGVADAALEFDARGINRGGVHWYDVMVGRADCVPTLERSCRFSMQWRAQDGVWPVYGDTESLALSGAVDVPGAFTDWFGLATGLRVGIDGRWIRDAGTGGGYFSLLVDAIGLPGDVTAAVRADVRSLVSDNVHDGALVDLTVTAADQRLPLGTVAFRGGIEGLEFWSEQLALGEIGGFLTGALRGVDVAHRWLDALQLDGTAYNVRANLALEGLSYAATLDGIQLEPYKGVPRVRDAAGEIFGYERGAVFALNSQALQVHFADTFDEGWQLDNVQGALLGWFNGDYFGLRAPFLRAETGTSRSVGGFSLTRPPGYYDQRVAFLINVDRMDVVEAKTFLPFRLPEQLKQWLEQGPLGGELKDASFAYQGQVHTEPNDQSRRIELHALVENATVSYDPNWPVVTEVKADLTVAGTDVFTDVRSAKSMGSNITNTRVRLFDNGAYAEVDLRAEVDAGVGLDFVRGSPLQQWMAFVTPDWDGAGSVSLEGRLFIPIAEALADRSVDVALDVSLSEVELEIPDYRLSLGALHGSAHYQFPHYLTSDTLTGELFGRPVTIESTADDDSVDFHILGTATPADVYQLANMQDYGLAEGLFPFEADLSVAVDDQASQMMANTELVGLTINLPGEFAKAANVPRSTEVNLQFLDSYTAMQIRHGNVNAWFHVDDVPLRGAIGVGTSPPMVTSTTDEVIVTGRVAEVDVNEWVENAGGLELPIPWRLQRVMVDQVRVENTLFDELIVDGTSRDGVMELRFAGTDIDGRLVESGDAPLDLYFKNLTIPDEPDEGDPFDVSIIDKLPEANVTIDALTIGEDDFGSWAFTIRNRDDGVLFGDLSANLKGTAITAPEGVFWSAADNRSRTRATLTMGNLADVLPLWDYAASLESETASLAVDTSWPGSPLNVEINGLQGTVVFNATDGSFLEISSGSGAVRILSLLNFSTITKRLNFDFSDVIGKGVSFDTIEASTRFDEGTMVFVEPMEVEGSGSDFRIGGSVNFKEDLIAADMIVTLPVSESLPWYAAYVALANPLLGLGVLVGQQVLKEPLKQLSSAKYEITGSLSDPQVNFVELFGSKIQTAEEALEDAESVVREGGP